MELFLDTWLDLMKKDGFFLTKGAHNVPPNNMDRHRHDQSILSLLWHQSTMATIPDETYLDSNQKFDSTKPFWVSRNRELAKIDSPAILRQVARVVRKIFIVIKGFR